MTAKDWTEKTVKDLVKRKVYKNKVLKNALDGIAIDRCYKAKKRVNAMRG